MNPEPIIPSMFLHRLKNEFSENLKLVLALWITLGVALWSFCKWWFEPLGEVSDFSQVAGAFAGIGIGLVAFFLITTLFKRDDLKHPQEFWATRPIRSFTLFGTKLLFSWLVIALPCGLLMATIGLIAGVGSSAFWNGLEVMVWVGFATNLLALSCMAYPGNRALLGCLGFFGGVIVVCIAINNPPLRTLLRSHEVSSQQLGWNLLLVLIGLNAWFGFRCWCLIRDKHATQSTLVLVALGILIVPLIAFVPLPGKLPMIGLGAPSITLPTATDAESNGTNFSYGDRYGANFASVQIELTPTGLVGADGWEVVGSKLQVEGEDNLLQAVECSWVQVFHGGSAVASIEKPVLTYFVYDRQPGSGGGSSSSSGGDNNEIISALPRRKVRITGAITLNRIDYRELASGFLDQPFSHRGGGIVSSYLPSTSDVARARRNAMWKAFSPPLVTSRYGQRRESARYRVEDPASKDIDWTNQLGGGSSGGGAFFGSYRMSEFSVSDDEIESDYYWRRLKESGYEKSVQEWKKETRLICEVVDRITPVILPVDIEVEVPDPDKVRELLVKGALR